MHKSKLVFFYSVGVFISLIVVVLVFEVSLFIYHSQDPLSETRNANILRNFKHEYQITELYETDIDVVKYHRDAYGLRDNCEHPKNIDVLTIGGSTTDQRYVPLEDTFQIVLQQSLREADPKFGCVTNAGVDGHSTWGHLYSFQKWFPLIPDLEPKVILLYIGINDAYLNTSNQPRTGYDLNSRDSFKDLLRLSHLVQELMPIFKLLSQRFGPDKIEHAVHRKQDFALTVFSEKKISSDTPYLSEENAETFGRRLQAVLELAEQMSESVICITQPHRYVRNIEGTSLGKPNVLPNNLSGLDYDFALKLVNKKIFQICPNVIDLYSVKFDDSHFYDGVHTTAAGSRYIGNILAEELVKLSLGDRGPNNKEK